MFKHLGRIFRDHTQTCNIGTCKSQISAQFPASPGPSEQQPALQCIPISGLVTATWQRMPPVPPGSPLGETRSNTGANTGLRDMSSSWLTAGLCSADYTSLSLVAQPIFHPPYFCLIQPIPPLWWWRHNGRLCQKLRGAITLPSPPDCWLPHHRKQIYTSLGVVWFIPEFSQLCTALPPPSRMWYHLPASSGADIPPTSPHAAVKAIKPGSEQLIPKYSLQLSKPLVFWEKYRWWHSRWNNYVVESCNIYVKGYYTRAPNVSKITSGKQHAGFACLSPAVVMLTHVYVQTYMGFYC